MPGKVWSHFTPLASEVLLAETRLRSEERKEGARPPEFCLSGSDCLITRQSGCWFLSWSQPSRRCRYFYPRDASEIWRDKKSSGNEKYESVEFHESRNVICPLTKGALWHIFPILIISTNSPKHPCPVRHDHSLFILSWNLKITSELKIQILKMFSTQNFPKLYVLATWRWQWWS